MDLRSNIAAEARAKIVYERLIDFCDDSGTKEALQFLMTREITHMRAFTQALESLGKGPYSIGRIPPTPGIVDQYYNDSTGEGDNGEADVTGPWNDNDQIAVVESPALKEFQVVKATPEKGDTGRRKSKWGCRRGGETHAAKNESSRYRGPGALQLGPAPAAAADTSNAESSGLPQDKIEKALQAKGEMEHGVLAIDLARGGIGKVQGPEGVTFSPEFGINGEILFQSMPGGKTFMNGDLPLREEEVNPFISALLAEGLVLQAFHQHVPTHPQIWFVHFRGHGDAVEIARALKSALDKTRTPFPQTPPQNPETPLKPDQLARILHGHASVGEGGVVTVWVYRKNPIHVAGVALDPRANVSTNIEFNPLGKGGQAAVLADFAMTGQEVTPVLILMRNKLEWYQGCLYNQEIEENPQLFFDHMLKSGDASELAKEIRQGLDLTDAG